MLVFWVAQFEIEAEISLSITNPEVELCLATALGPDFHDLMEAAEKEGFFCILTREHLLASKLRRFCKRFYTTGMAAMAGICLN